MREISGATGYLPARTVFAKACREGGRRGPEAQRLIEDLPDIAQRTNLVFLRRRRQITAEHGIHFVIGLRQRVWFVEQKVEREREKPAVVSWPATRNVRI